MRFSDFKMNGTEVFRFATKAVPQTIKADLKVSDMDWLLIHQVYTAHIYWFYNLYQKLTPFICGLLCLQANQRIIDRVALELEFPKDKVISNLENYGNTSAASIPLALIRRSSPKWASETIMTAGFGAGLTWASAIVRWG